MAATRRFEQVFGRDAELDVTLVSQSNFLLLRPMLAEVAASELEAQRIGAPVPRRVRGPASAARRSRRSIPRRVS
jgi:NADH dehydrogenase FAD-containing subunit